MSTSVGLSVNGNERRSAVKVGSDLNSTNIPNVLNQDGTIYKLHSALLG